MEVWSKRLESTARLRCFGTRFDAPSLIHREAILMSLMALLVVDDNKEESLVETVRELFRSWADQIAAHDGDGLLVSMWYVPFIWRNLTEVSLPI